MASLLTSSSSLKLDHVNSIYKQTITLRSSVSKKTHKNNLIFIGVSNISKNIRGNLVRKAQLTCVMTLSRNEPDEICVFKFHKHLDAFLVAFPCAYLYPRQYHNRDKTAVILITVHFWFVIRKLQDMVVIASWTWKVRFQTLKQMSIIKCSTDVSLNFPVISTNFYVF